MFVTTTHRRTLIALAIAGLAGPALAQTGSIADPAQLQVINVIGEKTSGYAPESTELGMFRGMDLLDIPATINIVSREILDEQGATGLHDALRNVAGVVRQQQSGVAYDQLSVRGINLDNRSSYMFNGVLPFDNNLPLPMEDKERMEVLKGAAALYYGFVDPGGVVNMVTKRAGSKPVTTLNLSTDDQGLALAHVDIGRRFGARQQFGVRINALTNNIHSPIDQDHGYRRLFSAALDWRVNQALTLKYDVERIRASITEQAAVVPPAAVGGVVTLPALPDPSRLLSMRGKDTKSEATTHLLAADYAINGNWSARFSAGESRTRRDRWLWIFDSYNSGTGAGNVYGADQPGQDYLNQNLRAEINGRFKTGTIGHDVLFGLSQNRLYQPSFNTYMYRAAQNLYAPVEVAALIRAPGGSKNVLRDRAFYEQTVRNGGGFVMDRVTLNEQWSLVAALRYSKYKSDQLNSDSYQASASSPAVSVVYKLTPRTSLYGSYIEGLESAGSAPTSADNAGQSLPAVVSKQKELGLRSKVMGDLMASAAYFELARPSAGTDSDNIYALNGKERYRGLEMSLQGDVGKNLSVMTSLMLLDAEVRSSTTANLVGKTPENTPRRTASVFASYRLPQLQALSLNAGAYAMGARPINALNQASIPGYTIFTAGMRYRTAFFGTPTTLRATVENLSDKQYWSAAGSGQLAVGMPRSVTLASSFEF